MRRLCTLLLILAACAAFGQDRLSLATHEQLPLTYIDSHGHPDGTAMKPVLFALKAMNRESDIRFLPWTRAQELVKAGEMDGFFAASKNDEREGYAVRSESIARQTMNWYLLADNPLNPNDPSFRGSAKVCSYSGANMLTWLIDNGYTVASPPSHPDQLFLMLANGRFDACLANSYNYENFAAAYPEYADRFRAVEQASNELYVYFSRRFIDCNPGFLPEFNQYVREYRKKAGI